MSVHVAVVVEMYERLILGGRKTIECRLTQQPREPFGVIVPGERVYFKRSGGPFFAAAVVDRVWTTDNLTPELIDQLRKQFDKLIHGTPEYWKARRGCRYATLVWLREVTPTAQHPRYKPQNMRAWYTLPESAAPTPSPASPRAGEGWGEGTNSRPAPRNAFDITLTSGAIKNRYVRLGEHRAAFSPGKPITLKLHGGPVVETDVIDTPPSRAMFRWRGWKAWFEACGVKAGDRLRFTPDGPRAFIVTVVT